ncbi:MAG: phosphate acyltransferase PlsX [Pseudomonadales bacterium]|nr:phosphate acyltransferase PlsX [Pseudomonadales bacterium]
MRIAVDLMGGDRGAADLIPAATRCLSEFADLEVIMVGDQSLIESVLAASATTRSRVRIEGSDDVVEMTDRPSMALRQRRGSSMFRAVELVRDGEADACVSTGNTGALMAIGRHLLKTVPGIDRPAIIKAIPSTRGKCYLLDLGANINCDAENLIQFAAMGSLMCGAVEGIERPSVGLLNIGEEEMKGEGSVLTAAQLLKELKGINFIGFVEGDGIYQSDADVLVCDGMVGNIALKTSEGLARFVASMIEDAFRENFVTRAAGIVAGPVLLRLKAELSPENYNGATLLGLSRVVVKSHGDSSTDGFYAAIREAMRCVEQDIPGLLKRRLDDVLAS